jgi:hypothetical protein
MHYGNIGSFLAGLASVIAAVAAVYGVVKYGPGWLQDARNRQQAQTTKANEEANLAREQAQQIVLDRRRQLYGWSQHGIADFTVALVTTAEEMTQARDELARGDASDYVILRVTGRAQGNANRAQRLRMVIESEGMIARPPTAGEREALETGLRELDIPKAAHA